MLAIFIFEYLYIQSCINILTIRVIKAMPLWKPGKQRLKNVAVNMKLPIKFLLN